MKKATLYRQIMQHGRREERLFYAPCRQHSASRRWLLITLMVIISLFATQSYGKDAVKIQSLNSVQEIARDFLHEQAMVNPNNQVKIHLGRLDPRLRLEACEIRPQAFLPAGSGLQGKLTVGVQCQGKKPWTVYIPANIQIFANILTTSRPISRGDMITNADIISRQQEISKLQRGYYRQPEEIIGKLAARSLPAGVPLSPRMLKAQLMVRRGDDVTILATIGSLQVRSKGTALQNAARGERISVRNTRSKRVIEGIAIKPGTIQVHM